MSNSISYPVKYLNMLDRIYKEAAVTADLTPAAANFRFSTENEKTVYLKEMSLQGLGDYSRASGYDTGDITISWRAYTMGQDRSKKFNLDALDEMEALQTIAEVAAEFQRNHVAPELDAYRFEKICTTCSLDVSANLTYDTVIAAIRTGIKTLNDAEVPKQNRILYVSSDIMEKMEDSGEFFKTINVMNNNGVIDTSIKSFNNMQIVEVPAARFYNNFDFAASGAGGFSAAGGSKALNFMIAYKPVLCAVIKHVSPKIIAPINNADYDGWIYAYRIYHDLFIPEQKKNGVYIHSVA